MRFLPGSAPGGAAPLRCAGVRIAVLVCLSFLPLPAAVGQASAADFVTVQSRLHSSTLIAYARVAPVSTVSVSAAETGVVTGLNVRPGSHVRAGQVLAHLSGPAIDSLLAQNQANVRSAQSQLDAAQKTLQILRQQLPAHLTTRQAVQQAQSALAQARGNLLNAQSRLQTIRQLRTLSAPANGIVVQLSSADGALVSAGQPVLTLQPAHGLWLLADYYGADLNAIHIGMTGQFAPAQGGEPVKVRVASIPGSLGAGGGESIALEPAGSHPGWLSGEAGTVTLNLPARQMVAVPTRALILDQGKWWVMVHTAKGNRPQQVVPGPAQDWDTLLRSGLAPGAKVVVNHAYLLFHAGIAEQYQIPD